MADQRKRAVVTGAASGIGKAVARRLIAAGVDVVIADIDRAAVERTVGELDTGAVRAIPCELDVTDDRQCERIGHEFGTVDILVANAGIQTGGTLLEAGNADWDAVIGVNLTGAASCCRAVIPGMQKRGAGAIVIVSSNNAISGSHGMAAYDASKAGLLALTRSIAIEHGRDGIRANSVCPGTTITDYHINRLAKQGIDKAEIHAMTAGTGLLGRAAQPDEIANAICFLASDEASYVTGANLMVDGGFSLAGGH